MSTLIYSEVPLDPRRIRRHWRDAGLAFEKHRWRLPSRTDADVLIQLFTFGMEPLREMHTQRPVGSDEEIEAVPAALDVMPEAFDLRVCCSILAETGPAPDGMVDPLVTGWPTPLHLVFNWAPLPPIDAPPVHTRQLVDSILGRQWAGGDRPGWVPLPDDETRRRAVHALGSKGFHRMYLVAGPSDPAQLPPASRALFAGLNGLTAVDEPDVDYRAFHGLLSHCDWVLTTHRHASGAVPYCFYSDQDLRDAFSRFANSSGRVLTNCETVEAFNAAAGVAVEPRGGLTLSDIMPPAMIADRHTVNLAWSDLDRVDELPTLPHAEHLDLEGTLVNELGPLAEMTQLGSLSLGCLQVDSLRPLTQVPSLKHLALSQMPADGLAALAAMPHLTSLDLHRLPIEDATPLVACRRLRSLSLDRTPLDGLDEVARITSLERLSIRATAIRSLQPLTGLVALRELAADGCSLNDLDSLPHMVQLEALGLEGLERTPLVIPDPAPIAAMAALKHLRLARTTFRELPPGPLGGTLETLDISLSLAESLNWLKPFTALRALSLAYVRGVNLECLADLANMESLDLSGCDVTNLDWAMSLSKMRDLKLGFTRFANVQSVIGMRGLRSLDLSGPGEDRPPITADLLSALNDLEVLNLYRWRLGNPAPLTGLKRLRELNLSHTDLDDAAPLSALTRLADLDVSHTPARSIDGFGALRELRRLNLESTPVTDLTPLERATHLEILRLRRTKVRSLEPLAALRHLTHLDLRGVRPWETDFRPLMDLPRLALLRIDTQDIEVDLLRELQRRHRVVVTPE